MKNITVTEKTLTATLVNLYTKESIELVLPLSEDELTLKLTEFNPNENECEVDNTSLILTPESGLTPLHQTMLKDLDNNHIENINKVAAILQEDADFAFLFCACEASFDYAYKVFTKKTYTIFKNVPDDESFVKACAKYKELLNPIDYPYYSGTLDNNFDYGEHSIALFNNEVMKSVTNDIVVYLHKTS